MGAARPHPGVLFIVSSHSGGGKTTLIKRAIEALQARGRKAYFSVSHTTRPVCPGEEDGRDYHFVDETEFDRMVQKGAFLEWARYAGNLYGTSRAEVEGRLSRGVDVFLDIEVQGAQQVKTAVPGAVKIFVFPPSYPELKRRLKLRRQDAPEVIRRRLGEALREFGVSGEFDYAIINDRLDEAAEVLTAVCLAEQHRLARMKPQLDVIREAFQASLEEDSTS
jgi:guanylate kinase